MYTNNAVFAGIMIIYDPVFLGKYCEINISLALRVLVCSARRELIYYQVTCYVAPYRILFIFENKENLSLLLGTMSQRYSLVESDYSFYNTLA